MSRLLCIRVVADALQLFFFFNVTPTTEIYTLSLHDALPICLDLQHRFGEDEAGGLARELLHEGLELDRKSTRLNSSHANISYAVFCLKKKSNCRRPASWSALENVRV